MNRAVYVYYYVDGGHVALACKTVVQPGGKFGCDRGGFQPGQLIHVFAQTGADMYNAAGRSRPEAPAVLAARARHAKTKGPVREDGALRRA